MDDIEFNQQETKARQFFADGRIIDALDVLDDLYNERQTFALNQFVTEVLIADGQFQLAEMIMDEFVDEYLETKPEAYMAVLMHNRHFLKAREFSLETAVSAALLSEIETAEAAYAEDMRETIQTIQRHFYHLSNEDVAQQAHRLEEAEKLPYEAYVHGAQYLLVDPYIHPITRATIIDRLRRLAVNQPVKSDWLQDQQITFFPAKLVAIDDTVEFKDIKQALEKYQNFDDQQLETLLATVRLALMVAYPALDRVVKDPDQWAQAVLAEMVGEEYANEDPTQRALRRELQEKSLALLMWAP